MLTKIYRAAVGLLALIVFSTGSTSRALAVFMFQSESAIFEPLTNKVLFTIQFNQPPNFSTVDSIGRQANSFQYFIVGDPGLPYPAKYDSIIRGDEIHLSIDALRIRNSVPPDPGPVAVTGGWGSIRGEVPFNVNGNIVTFSTPLSLISDHSMNGIFEYRLESSEFGGFTQFAENQSTVATEPASAILMAMGCITLFCWYGRMRRRNPQWN
jgi:hypothetical protein